MSNTYVTYHHFKMETIESVLQMVTPHCWMASLDLKDAYYSVKLHPDDQRYLKFIFNDQLYQYTAFPDGSSSCPRQFTKLVKPPLATLRAQGHIIASYIDDIYLQSATYDGCVCTILATFKLFDQLGFVIRPEKSDFYPKHQLTFLGFVIDSALMQIRLKPQREEKLKAVLQSTRAHAQCLKIRDTACAVGHIISSLPAVPSGGIHYRWLERDKILALKRARGNFQAYMSLSEEAIQELDWWLTNFAGSFAPIFQPPFDITLYSDASLMGWGAALENSSTGGKWTNSEASLHINALELLAAYFALKAFHSVLVGKHIKLMLDSTTAVAVINHMGTNHSDACNRIAIKIWTFCQEHNMWLTACHIPGKSNTIADLESRGLAKQDAEWMINSDILTSALL